MSPDVARSGLGSLLAAYLGSALQRDFGTAEQGAVVQDLAGERQAGIENQVEQHFRNAGLEGNPAFGLA